MENISKLSSQFFSAIENYPICNNKQRDLGGSSSKLPTEFLLYSSRKHDLEE